MSAQQQPDLVTEPFAHISISGVHGGSELDQRRLRRAEAYVPAMDRDVLLPLLVGAAVGAAFMYLLRR